MSRCPRRGRATARCRTTSSPGRHRDADVAGRVFAARSMSDGYEELRTWRTETLNLRTAEPTEPGNTAMAKKALITGVTGQDGSYLAELLLEQGLQGDWRHPPAERAQRLAHPAPARPDHAGAGRPARSALAHQGRRVVRAGRVLQPRGDVVRPVVVGSADADRRVQRAGRDSRARGDSQRQPEDPLLSGLVQRDVRAGRAKCRRPR